MKPLRHWLRWLSIACGRAPYAARPLPACAWLVALVLLGSGRPCAEAREGLLQLRHRHLVDRGRAAADQRAEPGAGSHRVPVGGHAERTGAIRWRPLPDVFARGHAGAAGHLGPRPAFRSTQSPVDRHLQGTRAATKTVVSARSRQSTLGAIPSLDIFSIVEQADGTIVVGTSEGVFRVDGDHLVHAPGPAPALSLLPRKDGLWVGTTGAVERVTGTQPVRMALPADAASAAVVRLADTQGRLWAGTSQGLYALGPDAWQPVTAATGVRPLADHRDARRPRRQPVDRQQRRPGAVPRRRLAGVRPRYLSARVSAGHRCAGGSRRQPVAGQPAQRHRPPVERLDATLQRRRRPARSDRVVAVARRRSWDCRRDLGGHQRRPEPVRPRPLPAGRARRCTAASAGLQPARRTRPGLDRHAARTRALARRASRSAARNWHRWPARRSTGSSAIATAACGSPPPTACSIWSTAGSIASRRRRDCATRACA